MHNSDVFCVIHWLETAVVLDAPTRRPTHKYDNTKNEQANGVQAHENNHRCPALPSSVHCVDLATLQLNQSHGENPTWLNSPLFQHYPIL